MRLFASYFIRTVGGSRYVKVGAAENWFIEPGPPSNGDFIIYAEYEIISLTVL